MKRETMMLANNYDPKKHYIGGWMVSEKIDGIRCFWDGGVTRGMRSKDVPWANTEKDGRFINEQIATGLWSRYYKPIMAPDWWLNYLPVGITLDGELYSKSGWQTTSSIVRTIYLREEDKEWGRWGKIRFYVFDSPPLKKIFSDGKINNPNIKKELRGCVEWIERVWERGAKEGENREFEFTYKWLKAMFEREGNEEKIIKILEQTTLPTKDSDARKELGRKLTEVIGRGGEGLIIRSPYSLWTPERSKELLKVKGELDDEGIVIGYIGGKGKLSGLFGALVLNYKGKRLELSGFTDDERRMVRGGEDTLIPENLGGVELGNEYEGKYFKRGDVVTFKYRELSDSGIPKEAVYWRKLRS